MNEIEFVSKARQLTTGDLILFSAQEAGEPAVPDLAHACAAGFVLRFVDPAKPLLVHRTRPGIVGIDFFQDCIYAADPPIVAKAFTVQQVLHGSDELADRWRSHLELLTGRPLDGDTPLYEAYSAGCFGASYDEPQTREATLAEWVRFHLRLLGTSPERLSPPEAASLIWDGHDVYAFG